MPSVHCSSNARLPRNVSGTSLSFYFDQQIGGMMMDDTIRLVYVYMVLGEIFSKSVWAKSAKSVMVWTSDKSSAGLI